MRLMMAASRKTDQHQNCINKKFKMPFERVERTSLQINAKAKDKIGYRNQVTHAHTELVYMHGTTKLLI